LKARADYDKMEAFDKKIFLQENALKFSKENNLFLNFETADQFQSFLRLFNLYCSTFPHPKYFILFFALI